MKKLNLIFLFALLSNILLAQAPQKMTYQSVVRDGSNNLLSNESIGVRISILQGSSTGAAIYEETHSVTSNVNGLITLEIGNGTVSSGNFSTIDWGNNLYFVKSEIDPAGGTNYSISGTSQLVSVPYALHAETASNVPGLSLSLNDLNNVNTSGATANQVLSFDGTNWVPITTSGGTVYSAGTGLLLSGTTFSNTAPDQIVTLIGSGATSIIGTYPNFTISSTDNNTTYTAGTGLSLSGTTFSNTAPDQTVSLTGSGATSIIGTYPNFTISSTDNNTTYTAGTGLSLSGTTFSAQNTAALWNANQLQGRNITTTAPSTNQVLGWDGTNWTPMADANTTYTAGTGLSLSGTTFSNTAPDQTVSLTGSGATSIIGTYPNFTISSTDNNTTYTAGTGLSLSGTTFSAQNTTALWNANQLQGRAIVTTAPTSGQALVWNGSSWAPATISSSQWITTGSDIYYSAGRVAVGTTSPAYKFHVVHSPVNNTDNRAINITADGYTDATTNSFGLRNALVGNGSALNHGIYSEVTGAAEATAGSNYGFFASLPSGSGANLMGIRSNVTDGASLRNYAMYGWSGGTSATFNIGGIFIADGSSTNTNYGVYASGENAGGGTSYGIFADGLLATYAGYFDGDVTVTGIFSNPSDKKLKRNISQMEVSAIPNIMKLDVKTYEYNSAETMKMKLPKGKQFGFLAQDMELVYPELVSNQKQIKPIKEGSTEESETIEYKAINYIGLIPILTKAIQEQELKIENLEKKNAELEERLSKLEKMIKD